MDALKRQFLLNRNTAAMDKETITPPDTSAASFAARGGLSAELGATMFPDAEPTTPSAEIQARAADERRRAAAEAEREAELETPHPLPSDVTPVTVGTGIGTVGRTPAFQLPGPSADIAGAEPRRVYGRSWKEARDIADIGEVRLPFAAKHVEEAETKAAWRKAANERRQVNLGEIREEMAGVRPSKMETGATGEKESVDWEPSFPEKVRRGTVGVLESPISIAVAAGQAAPGLLLNDPVTQRALAMAGIDTAEQAGQFGKALWADPVGVISEMWDKDPVLVGQLLALPLSGGGSLLTALERLSVKLPKLAKVLKVAGSVGRGMTAAGGHASSVPIKLGLTSTGLPVPGSYVHDAAKLIAGSDIMPPSLRAAARRVILKPTEALETLSPELRALARGQVMPGVDERVAAEAALSKLYDMADTIEHPISGETVPTRQLFTEIIHAQPRHWRNQIVTEATSTRWTDPKTGALFGGKSALPEDETVFARLKMVGELENMDPGEFMRKKLLAREFAGKEDLPPTLEEYGLTIQWRDPSGKVFTPKDLSPDAKILKGLKPEYVPAAEPVIRPPETPFALSFQEKQAQTGIPLRPAPERTNPPGIGEAVADINQREIPFPLPEKGPQPRPGQTIGGLPATVQEGVDFSGRAPFSRPVEWDKLPPDLVGTERVDYPWVPPSGFSGAEKTAARMGLGPLPKPTIAAPQIVYEVLKDQRAAPTRAFDVTADQFVARFQGRPELAQMHPYNRAVALRDAHREIVEKLRGANHPIAPQVLAEYPNVAAQGESGIQLASEFTPPPERATGELRMGPVEITPPPPGPRGFMPGEQRGPAANIPVPPPTPFRFDVGAAPEAPKVVPPVGPVGVVGKPGAPEIPFLRHGEYPGKPRGLPSGEIQGELPLARPPKGGFPVPAKPIVLAPEGSPPLVVGEGPKGRMVASAAPTPATMKTPKPPKMSDKHWDLVREVVQPIREIIDNLGARAAELGVVEGDDVIRRFGSYLSRRYDWDALLKKNPELAMKMKVIQEKMGAATPVEAAAARYSEYLKFANEGQDIAARRVIGDLPMQTLRDAYELMADGPSVVRDTTLRLANAVSRAEFMEGVASLPGAITSEKVLPSGWKRVSSAKLASGRPEMGALAGKGVSPEVWDALKLLDDLNEGSSQSMKWLARAAAENEPGARFAYGVLKGETSGVKAWKQIHVLWPYNLTALPRNFLNASLNQAVMGNLAPWHLSNARAYIRVANELRKGGGAALDEWRAASAASGGRSLLDDARMRSAVYEAAGELTWPKVKAALRNGIKQDVEWLKIAKKWGIDKPAELYAASDEYFKAVAYTIVRDMQRGFESGDATKMAAALKKARSIWGVEAEARLAGGPRAALRHAYEAFLDYSDVPGWVSAVSKFGIAPFYKFTALTAEQITNYFRRRPLHALALRALGDYSERFLSYAHGYTPEEVDEAMRVSPAYRGSQVFVTRDKIGRPLSVQSQYLTSAGAPWSPQREFTEGGATQALSEMLYGGPVAQALLLPTQLGGSPASDWYTGRPLSPPSAPPEIKEQRLLAKAWQLAGPPALTFTLPAFTAALRGEPAPHQTDVQTPGTVLRGALTGTKLAATDMPRRKAVLFADYNRRIRELDSEIYRLAISGTAEDVGQIPAFKRQKNALLLEILEREGVPK